MTHPWEVNDYQFNLSAVMGVIRHTEAAQTLEEVITSIEYAVVQAKTGRYGQICYCDREMLSKLKRRRRIIQILKDKLADESFEMFYQPIYEVKTGKFLYEMCIRDSSISTPHAVQNTAKLKNPEIKRTT